VTLPKLSIAAKLYVIFALMAATTLALSVVAVQRARSHAALTEAFKSANAGSLHVERINGLLIAETVEAYAAAAAVNRQSAMLHAAAVAAIDEHISATLSDWQIVVDSDDASDYSQLSVWLSDFQVFVPELERLASAGELDAERAWVEKNDLEQKSQTLGKTLEALSRHYTERAQRIYTQIDEGISHTAMLLSLLAAFAVMLAVAGVLIISRGIARPINSITRVTEAVAAGEAEVAVPYAERRDEIGALARSIAVFQRAMRNN
jgi:methyl-accepting chemotaxis protein